MAERGDQETETRLDSKERIPAFNIEETSDTLEQEELITFR